MSKNVNKVRMAIGYKLLDIARKNYIRKTISSIGKVVEKDDGIYCYVSQKRINEEFGRDGTYCLYLCGFPAFDGEMLDKLNLRKPVYYVFDDIIFKGALDFNAYHASVIFKNCTFNNSIYSYHADDVTFEGNKYFDSYPTYSYGDCFFTIRNIDKLTFVNDSFVNGADRHATKFGMKVNANKIHFINARIVSSVQSSLNITADEAVITDSDVIGGEVYLDVKSITTSYGYIISSNGVIIENEYGDFCGKVLAPVIFYNGVDFSHTRRLMVDNDMAELHHARVKLIDELRSLRDMCEEESGHIIMDVKRSLDKRTIKRVFKKED